MKIKRIISTILTVLMSALLILPEYQVLAYEIGTPILNENTVSAYSTIENGQYYLKNKATGTYLTVDGAKATNAQNISVATKKETNAFLFGISGNATNGYYLSSQLNSAYVVNPYSDTPTNGTNITLYKKNSDGTQLFYFEEISGGYCLRSKYNTKLAITVSDNNVKLASYSGNNSQIWTLEKTVTEYASIKSGNYFLKNISTGTYLAVDAAKVANGQNISVSTKQSNNSFIFNISGDVTNGYYIGSLLNTSYVVNPYSDTPFNGTNITLYKKTTDGTQNWYFEKTNNGYYIRNNYNKNLVLGVDGSNVVLASKSNNTSQVWTLETVSESDGNDASGYIAQSNGYYFLKNVSTGTYMNFSKAANGQSAGMSSKSDTNAFKFHLIGNSTTGYLLASAINEAYVVNPYSDRPQNGTKVTLYKRSGDGTQNWFFKKNGTGLTIHNSYAQNCVITAGSSITISTDTSANNQTWVLEPAQLSFKPVENTINTYIDSFKWGTDNWSFSNASKNFKNGYAVNKTLKEKLFKENKISNADKEILKRQEKETFCGSCYGFTMTQLLAFNNQLSIDSYGGKKIVSENTVNTNTTSLINFYQISQSFRSSNQKFRRDSFSTKSSDNQSAKIKEIYNHFKNGGGAFNLCYVLTAVDAQGNLLNGGGHSVLCYGVTSCQNLNGGKGYYSSITGKYYGCKLIIADPNRLSNGKITDEACLYFDYNDGSWIIPYWNGASCTINKKKCVRYCYWNADSKKNFGYITQLYDYNCQTLSDDMETEHYLAGIDLIETSNNDYLIDVVSETGDNMYNAGDGNDIVQVNRFYEGEDALSGSEISNNEYALWNPTTNYCLVYDNPESYSINMDYEKVSYFGSAENSTYSEFSPEGMYIIEGDNINYDISIITEDDYCVTNWYTMSVTGNNTDAISYYLYDKGYILRADSLNNITIKAENDEVSPSLTFSTDATEVFIYEIDINTIGVSIDSDDNGSFETLIAQSDNHAQRYNLGDVNGDECVDSSDASSVLETYALSSTGKDISLTAEQKIAADVNKDGSIDSSDASTILAYYSYIQTGGTGTLEEFLKL